MFPQPSNLPVSSRSPSEEFFSSLVIVFVTQSHIFLAVHAVASCSTDLIIKITVLKKMFANQTQKINWQFFVIHAATPS